MHDPRIGRFFAVDPLTPRYPYYTPYSFSGNKVIHAIEYEGLEEVIISRHIHKDGTVTSQYFTYGEDDFKEKRKTFWSFASAEGSKGNWLEGYDSFTIYEGYEPHDWSGQSRGTLTITSYDINNDANLTISYDNTDVGIVDGHESAIDFMRMDGLMDMFVGVVGMVTAGGLEVGSLGFATPVAYSTFIYSADRFFGGGNKFFDPEGYINKNDEARPIKSLLMKTLGKSGETLYMVVEVGTGTASIYMAASNGVASTAEGAWEVFGGYETVNDAEQVMSDLMTDENEAKKGQYKETNSNSFPAGTKLNGKSCLDPPKTQERPLNLKGNLNPTSPLNRGNN